MQTRGSKFVKYQELRLQELPDQVRDSLLIVPHSKCFDRGLECT